MLANGEQERTVELTDSKLSHTFSNLAKYDSLGNEINYTVSESETNQGDLYFYADGVITGSAKDGYTITNTFSVPDEKVEVAVEKIWDDNNDLAKKRPNSITVNLLANGIVNQTVELTNSKLSHTFSNLAKYDSLGNEINYTVSEEETNPGDLYFYADGVITGSAKDGYTITNTFDVPDEKVEVTVVKAWADNNNEAQKRPDSIILQVKIGDTIVKEQVVSGDKVTDEGWSYTFTDLAKYDSLGNEITYTVDEAKVSSIFYTKSVNNETRTITNTFSVPDEKVEITVEKVWNDNNNQAQKRPDSIILQLKNGSTVVKEQVVTGNATTNEGWSYTFTDLAKYDSLGNLITYTVDEAEKVQGDLYFYEKTINGKTVINTFKVPADKVTIPVTKVWVDDNNALGYRPTSIVLQIKNSAGVVKEQVVTGNATTNEGWSYEFSVAKYDSIGNEITYTVDERPVNPGELDFYEKQISGRTITNTVIHLTTQKEVNKQQANPNETLTYTITVKNDSQKDLSGVVITDVVDTEHLNIVSTNGGEVQSDGKTIKWTKNISAGQTITITFTAKVKANVVPGTEIRNTAKVNGKDTNEVVTKVVKDIIIHKKEYPIKAVDIVLVMDVSGSMNDNSRLTNAKSAAEKLINEIFPDGAVNTGSTVTVLKFSTGASYVGKATSAQNKQQLINLIKSDNFKADGGTNIYEALSLTSSTLSTLTNTRKEVIFLTDGAPTPTFYIDLDNRVRNNDAGYSNNTDAKIAAKAAEVKAKATDVYSIGFAVNSLDDVRNRNSYAYCNYTRCTTSGCTQPHVSANGNKYHYETPRAYAKRTLGVIASDSSKVYYPTDSADSIINDFMEILRDITLTTTTIQAESTTVVIPVTQGYTLNETQKVVITINGVEHKVDFSDIGQYGLSYNSAKKEFTWNIANYLEDELELEFVIK